MDSKYSKIIDNTQGQNYSTMEHGLQQQKLFINQNNYYQSSKMASGYHGVNAPPLLPIDDFHMIDNPNKYSEDEKQLRIKLAAVYRLIEMNGWSMGIYNHVTVSVDVH